MNHVNRISSDLSRLAAAALLMVSGLCAWAADPEHWPQLEPQQDPEIEAFVEALLERMTLEQKIGQVIQAEIQYVTPEEVHEFGLGSVLNGGGSFPGRDREAPVAAWSELAADFHAAALQPRPDGRPAIPLLWGTDAVHGHSNVRGATVFPHNIGLGATRDADLVEAIARATAAEVAATGIDWNFAPTLAVARDLRWGRTYESFSSDPELVSALGRAAVIGLQGPLGDGWLARGRVLATAKHFVADGGTRDGIDQGDTQLEERDLVAIHGHPYEAALEAGAQTVMASFSSWNGKKMHGHRYLLTDVLKGRMGFDGFVVGDWNGHGQLPGCSVTDCVEALEAGVDMFMVPEDWREFRTTMLDHARNGRLSLERLDDAVRRILRVKQRAGLFDRRVEGARALPDPEAHAQLARRAVRQSLVLLKNNGRALPIDPGGRILVVGDGADDIGKQSGGWTLDWQGVTGINESFPRGQSIHEGIAEQVAAAGGQVHLGESGADGFAPDVVIAVIGEDPYAEGRGDRTTLEYQSGAKSDLALLKRLARLEAPVVTVFLSGRPLWVNPEINQSDAFMAAWLPGTEGGGVADVLLGDGNGGPRFQPTGRLPFAWPAEPEAGPDGEIAVLFDFGHGLEYGAGPDLPRLPETGLTPGAGAAGSEPTMAAFDGAARAPWRLVLHERGAPEVVLDGQTGQSGGAASLRIEPTDRHLQGDARRATWTGEAPAAAALAAPAPQDLSGLLEQGAALAFDLRLEGEAPEDLDLAIECGESCGGNVALAPELETWETGSWRRIGVDLACFAEAGADLARVTRIFTLATEEPLELSFADVRIEPGAADAATLRCPQ